MLKRISLLIFLLLLGTCSASLLTEQWSYKTGAFREILFDDLNNDGNLEIIILTDDTILVLNLQGKFLWSYETDDILSVIVSDLYSDNEKEIIFSSGNLIAGTARSFLWILSNNGKTLLKYPNSKVGSTILFNTLATEDLDANGYKEIIAGTSKGVYVFEDNYKEELWYNKDFLPADTMQKIFIEDVASDAKKDIVAKSFSRVYVIDFEGNVLWNFTIVNGIDVMQIEDILGEGTKNVVLISDGEMFILDKVGNVTEKISVAKNVNSMLVEDFDIDLKKEFVLSTEKNLSYFDNFELKWNYTFNESIRGVFFENVDLDEAKEFIVFTDSKLYGFSGNLTLKFTFTLPYKIKNVFLADLNADNEKEIIVNERDVLHIFKINKNFWKKKQADEFYGKATEKFNMKEYESAENELKNAKEIYETIRDTEGVLNCTLLSEEINKMKMQEKSKIANSYYEKAVSFYNLKEYTNATSDLLLAKEIFIEINDIDGILNCNSLLDEIEKTMKETAVTITTESETTTTNLENKLTFVDEKLILVSVLLLLMLIVLFFLIRKRGKKMRKSKILFVLGILVFSVIAVKALSDAQLADDYYAEAKVQYNLSNCKNASIYAEQAYNHYAKVGNIEKANEVNDFRMQKVDTCLRNQGSTYYQQAFNYYTQGGYGNYNLAKEFALKARELFSYLFSPGDLIGRCDTLIQNAEEKIKENKKEQAEGLYNDAYDLYKKRSDFSTAMSKANEAKKVYDSIGDEQGVQRCDVLIDNIQIDIRQTDEKAKFYYDKATDLYMAAQDNPTFRNFNKALEYAENASKLYAIVNDTAGYKNCQTLINNTKDAIGRNEEKLKEEAKKYYNAAVQFYLRGGSKFDEGQYELASELFKNATSASTTAKQIYSELVNWANDLKDPKEKDQKVKYYNSKVKECKDQLEEIANVESTINKKALAELQYENANKFYGLSQYENASIAVNDSNNIFQSISDWVGVSKCGALIRRINTALETLATANAAYNAAYSKYKTAEFDEAIVDLEKAKAIYQQINREQDIEKCSLLLKKIQDGKENKSDADKLYNEALKQYDDGMFKISNENARKANETYHEINFYSGVEQCNDLISKNNIKLEEIDKIQKLQNNIVIATCVIVFIIIVFLWQRDKWKKAELRKKALEAEEKRKEEARKREEEEKLRKEVEHMRELQVEREKLKALLEEEKNKLNK